MKTLLTILFFIISFNVHAESVVETIAQNKKWTASKIDNHNAWDTSACIASTPASDNKSLLEVYSEKTTSSNYTEPTIQILFAVGAQEVFSGEATADNIKKWSLTRASTPKDPNTQVLLARIDDRNAILDSLKKQNTFTVKLKDAKGKVLSTLNFSLSGSSKTITSQFDACKITFDVI